MTEVVLRDGAMVLTAVCPKCRHEFPTQPPPTSPTSTLCPCDVGPTAAPILGGGAAPAAWAQGHPPGQHSPVPPPAHSPSSAMLSLSITASSAASLNGGHVVVNTTPSAAPSSISVTATLPAGLPMWPWQSGQPGSTPTWAMMPTPAPPPATTWPTPGLAMPAMSLPAWAAPPQSLPAWAMAAMPAMPAAPLTLGLELFPRLPPQPQPQPVCALKGAQYRLTGGGILHERGHGGPHPHDAPVLLQPQQHPRGKPGAHACGPCGSLAPEQSPSTPLSFVLPGGALAGALAPEAVAADSAGTPEADLRLLQATTQALKASGWYYEGFSWQESAATLRSAAPGTFLVRDSSDPRFLFSLSVQTDRGPTSVRLLYIAGGFRLDAEPHLAPTMPLFPCVLQLIEHYAENRGKRACPPCQPPASQASALDGHQSRAGNRVQVWVDACGQVYSHILLTAPRRHTVPGLQHLARLAVHRQLKTAASSACPETPKARSERIKELELPTTLCRYLEEYPYTL